jgi:uncharacterized protein (DUF1810 family)
MDCHKINEFIRAQNEVYDNVVTELTAGRKLTHWMWFIFPQLAGLGSSAMAQKFALQTLNEAQLYAHHRLLGVRFRQCIELVLAIRGRSISEIFGHPDDSKFHSSMTLFSLAEPANPLFSMALEKYFHGILDAKTVLLLRDSSALDLRRESTAMA